MKLESVWVSPLLHVYCLKFLSFEETFKFHRIFSTCLRLFDFYVSPT